MEVWRSGWPFSGMPWGRLAFGVVDTPGRRGAAVRRRGRRQLPPRPVRRAAGLARRAARSRGRGAAGWRRSPGRRWRLLAARPWRRGRPRPTARSPWPRSRATCRATGTTCSTTTARSPRTTSTPPSTSPAGGGGGACRSPTSCSGRRTPPPSTRSPTPRPTPGSGPRRGDRRADPGRRDRRRRGADQVLNQGIVWDPQTGAGDRYTKRHPVPFGEYIPLRAVFTKYNFFDRLREVGRDMVSGTRREPLDIGGGEGRRRDLLRHRLRRRAHRPGRATAPSCSWCRPATRRSSTPTRPTSSSRSPGCARWRPAAGSPSPRPTASPGSSRPTAPSSPRPTSAPRRCWSSGSASPAS